MKIAKYRLVVEGSETEVILEYRPYSSFVQVSEPVNVEFTDLPEALEVVRARRLELLQKKMQKLQAEMEAA